MPSGSVTQADMRLSIVDGTAFVDFSAASVLTDYLGFRLEISDSAGKKLIGYIKAAGTGETYGSEILTNTTFEDISGFDTSTCSVASVSGGQTGNCLEITVTAGNANGGILSPSGFYTGGSSGSLYKYTGYTKNGTGTAVFSSTSQYDGSTYESIGAVDFNVSTSWTSFTLYSTSKVGTQWLSFSNLVVGDGLTGLVDTVSAKQITASSTTGVTITSTAGGTTYNWASEESGFNRNDSSGYTYLIQKSLPVFSNQYRFRGN